MKVGVVANADQQEEIESKNIKPGVEFFFVQSFLKLKPYETYDCIFYLCNKIDETDLKKIKEKPVFINEVIKTLEQKKLPSNFSRINGWPVFLKSKTWEIVSNNRDNTSKIFENLGWNIVFVKDEPGFVAARVISMIVNEAFFALEENVSSIEEIDLAMKLGTNYPYGPFEWLEKIGVENICNLLKELSDKDKRYSVAPLLAKKYLELIPSK